MLVVTGTSLIFAPTRGFKVYKGNSGGPVVADGPGGPAPWGVASAVLSSDGQRGHTVVVAPASPNSSRHRPIAASALPPA